MKKRETSQHRIVIISGCNLHQRSRSSGHQCAMAHRAAGRTMSLHHHTGQHSTGEEGRKTYPPTHPTAAPPQRPHNPHSNNGAPTQPQRLQIKAVFLWECHISSRFYENLSLPVDWTVMEIREDKSLVLEIISASTLLVITFYYFRLFNSLDRPFSFFLHKIHLIFRLFSRWY